MNDYYKQGFIKQAKHLGLEGKQADILFKAAETFNGDSGEQGLEYWNKHVQGYLANNSKKSEASKAIKKLPFWKEIKKSPEAVAEMNKKSNGGELYKIPHSEIKDLPGKADKPIFAALNKKEKEVYGKLK